MLAFVHRLPCREDDSVTAKDLSKVSFLVAFFLPWQCTEATACV